VTDNRELVITRVFDAPRELVFEAWSDPEHLKHWWGPHGFSLPFLEMDQRVGGKWRACMRGPDGTNHWQHGETKEMVFPERLVFTTVWESDPSGHEMVVSLDFVAKGNKTEMTLRQRIFRAVEERDGHRDGWSQSLDRLASYVAAIESERPHHPASDIG
jgi:uncharacterized protein YndB with AHSA1/START domain